VRAHVAAQGARGTEDCGRDTVATHAPRGVAQIRLGHS